MPKGKNSSELPQFEFDKLPLLLNEKQAALVLGVSESFLRLSRSNGQKDGRTPAPDFVRIADGTIRYSRDKLKKWHEQLEQRQAI